MVFNKIIVVNYIPRRFIHCINDPVTVTSHDGGETVYFNMIKL
jgi:hypothetical protein